MNLRRLGLRTVFAITLSVFAVGIGLLVEWFASAHTHRMMLHFLHRNAEVYANVVGRQCNLAGTKREIEQLIYAVGSNRDVQLLLVTGGDDIVLGSTVRPMLGRSGKELAEPLLEASTAAQPEFRLDAVSGSFDAVFPLRWSNINLPELSGPSGRVLVRIDAHDAAVEARDNERMLLLAVAGLLLPALACFLGLTRRHVLRPLASLRDSIARRRDAAGRNTSRAARADMPNAEMQGIATTLEELFDSLDRSEQMQKAIVQAAADAIITIDVGGLIRQWNPAAEKMFGIRAADAIGTNVSRIVPPPHAAAHGSYIQRYLDTGVAKLLGFPREVTALTAEGKEFPVGLSINQAISGGERFFVGVLRDMTDQVASRRELEAAKKAADAAAEAKAAFLACMSHEIRTPLTAILGYAEELERERLSPAELAEATAIIRNSGEHLLTIINDILDLSKLESGKANIECIPTRIDAVVMEVVRLMRPRAVTKGLALDFCLLSAMPESVLTDPTRIRQILINLVGNAIKFTQSGSVIVTIEAMFAEELVQISVVDTGIGIPQEKLVTLFEAFVQVDNGTTRRYGGTGLGLNISRRLAGMLGGGLVAESLDGTGSRFVLTLPTGPMKAAATGNRAATVNVEPRRKQVPKLQGRVLVADDGPDNHRLLRRILTDAGLEVTPVHDGLQAVAAVRDAAVPFDIVLMDIQMPGMDGIDATKALRMMGVTIPIIAVTANVLAEDRARAAAAGCNDFAAKPIDRRALYATLEAFLAGKASAAGDGAAPP